MAEVEGSSEQASGDQKKRKFPDGTNISQYRKYKTWTYRRWAWEFLCRNTNFRLACDKVSKGSKLAKSNVAKEFGLVKFKHYADVQTRSNVFPKLKDGAIYAIPNLGNEKLEKLVRILPGQVFIRFNLKTDVDTIAAIDAQIERARRRLRKSHVEYNQIDSAHVAEGDQGIETDSSVLIQYLRILDLKANGIISVKEIAAYLNGAKPGTPQYVNIDNLTRVLRRNKTIDYVNIYPIKGYRYLALQLKDEPGDK